MVILLLLKSTGPSSMALLLQLFIMCKISMLARKIIIVLLPIYKHLCALLMCVLGPLRTINNAQYGRGQHIVRLTTDRTPDGGQWDGWTNGRMAIL